MRVYNRRVSGHREWRIWHARTKRLREDYNGRTLQSGRWQSRDAGAACVRAARRFDISWVNPERGEYYLGDRSNAGIDIIDTRHNTFKRRLGGFVGVKLNSSGGVNNNLSGPDGVVSHGRWVYGGDGDSTLKVFDLDAPPASALKQSVATGGTTRVDEMALTTDGLLLLGANNAEDPPFGTLFAANGDFSTSQVSVITRVTVDPAIIPPNNGLSIEQPAWDPKTQRFYVSVPQTRPAALSTVRIPNRFAKAECS